MKKLIFMVAALASGSIFIGCKPKGAAGPTAVPPTQVIALAAKPQSVSETLSLVGTMVANEMVEISAETDGVVEEILFEEGQKVAKGQLLIRLDDTKFAAGLAETEANFKLSQANYDRSKQLFQDKLISQQEADQAAATFEFTRATLNLKKRQLKDARICAPFAGVMGSRNVSPGAIVSTFVRVPLTTLVDLDPLKVEVNVPERFLSQLKIGQTLEIKVAAYADKRFKGEVYFIAPSVDPATRTALVKARIANADFVLKPGMFANLDLTLQIRQQALVIPEVALMMNGDRVSIFVVDQEMKAQPRPVVLGIRLAGQVEIVKGLQAGEMVVVEGVQKLGPGSSVKLAPPEAIAAYQFKESKTGPATN